MLSINGREEHCGLTINLCKGGKFVEISVYCGNEGQIVEVPIKELIEVLRKYERQADSMEGEDEKSFPVSPK